MARGGKRSGTPGKSYGNRTDLNTPTPSTGYGTRVAQERAMAAVPIQPAPGGTVERGGGAGFSDPSPPLSLDRPTERPNEPLTAGLNIGPGPGSEVLGMPSPDDDMLLTLKALFKAYPHPDILDMILAEEDRR